MPFKLINLWQSPEERQAKYWLARSLGANHYHARVMRDWRLAKIERRYGLPVSPEAAKELHALGYFPQGYLFPQVSRPGG